MLTQAQIQERLERGLSVAEIFDLPGFRVSKMRNPRTTRPPRYMIQGANPGPAIKGNIKLIISRTQFRAAVVGIWLQVLPLIDEPLWRRLVQVILDEVQHVEFVDRRKGRRRRPDPQTPIGGGASKLRIRPKADLARRRKPVLRVNLAAMAQARPRPAAQLAFCGDCGDRFTPGVGPEQDTLCPICNDSRQRETYQLPPARPERRRAPGGGSADGRIWIHARRLHRGRGARLHRAGEALGPEDVSMKTLREAYAVCGLDEGVKLTAGDQRRLNVAHLRILGVPEAEIEYHARGPVAVEDKRPAAIQGRLAGF